MKNILTIVSILLLVSLLIGCNSTKANNNLCKNCSEPIPTGAKYCSNCGISTSEEQSSHNSNNVNEQNTLSNCLQCQQICEEGHLYCKDHECILDNCFLIKKSGSRFCGSHACALCTKQKHGSSSFCTSHMCEKCQNMRIGKKYCSEHKCALCEESVQFVGGKYCINHNK